MSVSGGSRSDGKRGVSGRNDVGCRPSGGCSSGSIGIGVFEGGNVEG